MPPVSYGTRPRRTVPQLVSALLSGGLILNVSSILGKRGMPFETAYCSSKFALAGFSEALRAEVASDGIDVTTIFPGAVETEIWQSAAARSGLEMPSFVPKFPARQLARVCLQNARFPQPEVVMALDAQVINFFNRLVPGMVDFVLGKAAPLLGRRREGSAEGDESR